MEDEYAGRLRKKKKNPLQKFFPVIGFIMALIFAAIAYVLSGPVNGMLQQQISNYPIDSMDVIQLIVGGVIFLILMLAAGMIYAVFAPRPEKLATEKQMERERSEKIRQKEAAKRRKREVQAKMARELKERNKQR